ncbi:SDR family oxidoreductase [Nostoc sp. FACHB-973]|nr:SDR family oxidoreductase [Nostoc sp. FACHB-973]
MNAISPGMVPTSGYDHLGLNDQQLQEFVDSQASAIPLLRVGTPDEIAKAVVFLASDDSWQYTNGVRNLEAISPDTWTLDQALLDRPGNIDIQLALKYDYQSNVRLYPQWQAYLRQHQAPTLIVWGKNDQGFLVEGAYAYKRDLKNLEFHLFDTGHFALEEDGDAIADHIRQFMTTHIAERIKL